MQLLQPKISFSIISLLSIVLAGITFALGLDTNIMVMLIITALVNLASSINIIQNFLKKESDFNLKLGFLITFVSAILISFTPYIFKFTDNTNSFVTTSIFSFVFLVVLFLTNTLDKKN